MLWRRPRRGMRLRLRGGFSKQVPERDYAVKAQELRGQIRDFPFNKSAPKFGQKTNDDDAKTERALNVVFNYNGESWDAYEVLGVPAGCHPDQVEKAFKEGMARVDETSKHFLEAAVRAIRKANRRAS